MRLFRFHRHAVSDEDLSAYVDDRLSTRDKGRVDAHLQSCNGCNRKLEETRSLVAEMRKLPETRAPRSFAISPELASATRREAERSRHDESTSTRRVYLGLSGATVAAAVLLIAVVGADFAFVDGGGSNADGSVTIGVAADRQAAPSTTESAAEGGATTKSTGDEQENVAPGVAPLPSIVAPDDSFAADAPAPAETPYDLEAAAAPQQAQPDADGSSRLWLWIVEGAAGGLIIGFGASAFWMRRRWLQINRS